VRVVFCYRGKIVKRSVSYNDTLSNVHRVWEVEELFQLCATPDQPNTLVGAGRHS